MHLVNQFTHMISFVYSTKNFWLVSTLIVALLGGVSVVRWRQTSLVPMRLLNHPTRIAFIGNSMLYFNDFPRFFEALTAFSFRSVSQHSCLHGGGSIPSVLMNGNGMYSQFGTPNAAIETMDNSTIYDYGACTVPQLLTGMDDRLDDPGYGNFTELIGDSPVTNQNPCRADPHYLQYSKAFFRQEIADGDYWNYVVINDNTRDPSRFATRMHSLQFLEAFYVPMLLPMQAIPIFLWTHAYSVPSTASRNMTGLDDVAQFTSLTGAGYRNYANLLSKHLPESRKPRIAPVGLGFLMVYEERPDLWIQLFHNADHLHASPSGSYLQGCIVYHTIFGEMPSRIPPSDVGWSQRFWKRARMMQHAWEPPNPYPSMEMTEYLYDVAERIMVHGELPKTYIEYNDDAVANEP
jgi:hypothetical protein